MLPCEKSCQIFQKRMSFPPKKRSSSFHISILVADLGFLCRLTFPKRLLFRSPFWFQDIPHTIKMWMKTCLFDILSISLPAVKMATSMGWSQPSWSDQNSPSRRDECQIHLPGDSKQAASSFSIGWLSNCMIPIFFHEKMLSSSTTVPTRNAETVEMTDPYRCSTTWLGWKYPPPNNSTWTMLWCWVFSHLGWSKSCLDILDSLCDENTRQGDLLIYLICIIC